MKTIGIIGSRRRNSQNDFELCERAFLEIYKPGDEIVSGGCPKGGDRFAEIIAKNHQVPIKIYYAQWDKLGRGAGFARNTNIAGDADIIIAVVAPDRKGGTEDTIKKTEKMGKNLIILSASPQEDIDFTDHTDLPDF